MVTTRFVVSVGLALLGVTNGLSATDYEDAYDLSFLIKGAAIGDSYAAGIGAGNQVDWGCSRYDGSYANLVAIQLGVDPSIQDFTYTACSGAVISGINDQAIALTSGQQYIIVSAGGNDADLVGILNSCVYSFWGGLSHPDCDMKLRESQDKIESSAFASSLDGLITNMKSKLAPGGNIYYVGYAKFFDTTDNTCDKVSWHMWINLFTREYLTQARRQNMNNLVAIMNSALRDAVTRAGAQVKFIDYDEVVDITGGRYCQPGMDESRGRGANLPNLFFYQTKTEDEPWFGRDEATVLWEQDLKRRQNSFNDDGDVEPANNTLNALYGALIQQAVSDNETVAVLTDDNANNDLDGETIPVLDDGNANSDLEQEVNEEEHFARARRRQPIPYHSGAHHYQIRNDNSSLSSTTLSTGSITSNTGSSWSVIPASLPGSQGYLTSSTQTTAYPSPPHWNKLSTPTIPLTSSHMSSVSIFSTTPSAAMAAMENRTSSPAYLKSADPSGRNDRSVSRSAWPASLGGSGSSISSAVSHSRASLAVWHGSNRPSNSNADFVGGSIPASLMRSLISPASSLSVLSRTASSPSMRSNIISSLRVQTNGNQTLGSKISSAFPSFNQYTNGTATGNSTSIGTLVANQTHVLFANGEAVELFNLKKLIISDKTSRTFHPTQAGHATVANLILYQMTADNAFSKGLLSEYPPPIVYGIGSDPSEIGGAACNTDSSDTWTGRDAMISALNTFCADPHNLRGNQGSTTSATFNAGTFDYLNISISWDNTQNIGEHSCSAWLDVVTDGCDVPTSSTNTGNLKHGGTIAYQSEVVNATLNITPLVVQRIWDKGRAGNQTCYDIEHRSYLDQRTLQNNINDFCTKFAAQPGGIAESGSRFAITYNDGTPDRVDLSTQWPRGPRNYQVFQEECQYYMSVINNGCSLPGDDNPMNWKAGGHLTDNNGIEYFIIPTQVRPAAPKAPLGSCEAKKKSWGYSWSLSGAGFANSDWGGELLSQVRGCGAVTHWKFEYLDPFSADGTEWTASGTLPLFISDHCLAKAVKSAGGYPSNC